LLYAETAKTEKDKTIHVYSATNEIALDSRARSGFSAS